MKFLFVLTHWELAVVREEKSTLLIVRHLLLFCSLL